MPWRNELQESHTERTQELFESELKRLFVRTDRMFALLMVIQFIAGIAAALWIAPSTWTGLESSVHVHVWAAVVLGGLLTAMPVFLALTRPGEFATRHVIAFSQIMFSALLIHLSGGRIETHFHVFVSLAFLACYRDNGVLLTGTVIVAADHLLRGIYWPESVYGALTASPLRTLEHALWVIFEDIVLVYSILNSRSDLWGIAIQQSQLENAHREVEQRVIERTKELHERTTELEDRTRDLESAETQLLQSEKLAAVGQLASGIAHEINTPIQFVGDNVRACSDMFADLDRLFNAYRGLHDEYCGKELTDEAITAIKSLEQEVDAEFIFDDAPVALEQTLDGVDRVRKIVLAMKNFAHCGGESSGGAFDINEALLSTMTVSKNEWKYVAELETNFGEVPSVWGSPSEINQVFLNLIVNAAHAITDSGKESGGKIGVTTQSDGDFVMVSISDNGCGMTEEVRSRMFEPFFTTKEVGRGSGQGLAIAYNIIVERGGGRIDVESEVGVGTTFHVALPTVAPPSIGEDAEHESESDPVFAVM